MKGYIIALLCFISGQTARMEKERRKQRLETAFGEFEEAHCRAEKVRGEVFESARISQAQVPDACSATRAYMKAITPARNPLLDTQFRGLP